MFKKGRLGKNIMWPAYRRSVNAVAPGSLEELRPARGVLALRCTLPGCAACAAFQTERRAAYEHNLKSSHGVVDILPWNCKSHHRRKLAVDAGVDDLPAYVFIPARGRIRVEEP